MISPIRFAARTSEEAETSVREARKGARGNTERTPREHVQLAELLRDSRGRGAKEIAGCSGLCLFWNFDFGKVTNQTERLHAPNLAAAEHMGKP